MKLKMPVQATLQNSQLEKPALLGLREINWGFSA